MNHTEPGTTAPLESVKTRHERDALWQSLDREEAKKAAHQPVNPLWASTPLAAWLLFAWFMDPWVALMVGIVALIMSSVLFKLMMPKSVRRAEEALDDLEILAQRKKAQAEVPDEQVPR